jgi:hypothetical protein
MKPLKTTKDRAAVLARLTESAKRQQTGAGERGQQPSVAVKILSAIPAGDSNQKSAMLMTRNGGTLQETGQTVLVRHVGEGSVSAGAIVTPEPCGRLGLCFTRSVQVVQAGVTLYRPMRLVGPIAPEGGVAAAYTEPWSFGPWQTRAMNYVPRGWATSGYYAECDFSVAPNGDPNSGWNSWIKLMQPVRYEIASYAGEFCRQLYDVQKGNAPFTYGYGGVSGGNLAIGESSGIGVVSHLSPIKIAGLGPSGSGVMCVDGISASRSTVLGSNNRYPVSTPEQGTPITGRYYTSVVSMFYYRVWIDGVDQTGIRATFGQSGWAPEPAEYLGKTAWFDFWPRYVVGLSKQGAPGEVIPANGTCNAVRQIGWIDPANNGYPCRLGATDYSQAITVTGSRFQLDFDVNGPFGLSTLIMQTDTAAGWLFTTPSNTQQMEKQTGFISPGIPQNGAIIVRLTLNWLESDRPLLTYVRRDFTTTNGWVTKTWYYRPEPSTDFAGTISPSGYNVKHGVWNPAAPAAFKLFAGYPQSGIGLEFRNAGDGIIPKADWLTVPQTITVTQV